MRHVQAATCEARASTYDPSSIHDSLNMLPANEASQVQKADKVCAQLTDGECFLSQAMEAMGKH